MHRQQLHERTQANTLSERPQIDVLQLLVALSVVTNIIAAALINQSINQSINARFVGRRYTTRPGAPAIVSCKHDQKVHS